MGTTRGKEERQMGSVVWKREVPQTVLEKCGMKRRASSLRSEALKEEGVGVRNEIEERQKRVG